MYRSASLREEVRREQRNVLATLGERRQLQRDDVQAVIEILAELARRLLRFEVAVRRRDDAHVDRKRLRRADRPHLALLEHAQQLHLQRQRHVADLVQEERAAVRPPGTAPCAPAPRP